MQGDGRDGVGLKIQTSGVAAGTRGEGPAAPTIKLTFSMIRYLLNKLGIICPVCGEKCWRFTYGKPQKYGC